MVKITGRAIVVRGHDIDTDRIVPARFLRAITFDGLEAHLFEDDRREAARRGATHAFDEPAREGARLLLVNANFGCGSSREHAPQAIYRWGIRAIVGESFGEIFFTNATAIGLPCLTVAPADVDRLMEIATASPEAEFAVDLEAARVEAGPIVVPAGLPETARQALMTGSWDATASLLERYEEVERTAERLPYLRGFSGT